ncbi:hypothetical protein [Bacillus weihaiensis]|uniref:hypothetical protein n=1 Tax=Bacillus weihaiensis TaxID=1547283 RepID=UPI0023570ED9|nr:hypothetical protein [Bacillus weihaiensis]
MNDVTEEVLTKVFYDDGSLRDIFVEQTTQDDWTTLWEFIKSLSKRTLSIDGEETDDIPDDVANIFKARKDISINISIDFNGVAFVCHFFCIEEIEFDVSPRQINNLMEAKVVFQFMESLSTLLRKAVSISIENDHDTSLVTVYSQGENLMYYR